MVESYNSKDSDTKGKCSGSSRQNTQADDRHRIILVEIPKILQDDKLNGMVNDAQYLISTN
jgi:hypothetical protein